MKFIKKKPEVGDLIKLDTLTGERVGEVVKIEGETLRYRWNDQILGVWINAGIIVGYASIKKSVSDEEKAENEEDIDTESNTAEKRK